MFVDVLFKEKEKKEKNTNNCRLATEHRKHRHAVRDEVRDEPHRSGSRMREPVRDVSAVRLGSKPARLGSVRSVESVGRVPEEVRAGSGFAVQKPAAAAERPERHVHVVDFTDLRQVQEPGLTWRSPAAQQQCSGPGKGWETTARHGHERDLGLVQLQPGLDKVPIPVPCFCAL